MFPRSFTILVLFASMLNAQQAPAPDTETQRRIDEAAASRAAAQQRIDAEVAQKQREQSRQRMNELLTDTRETIAKANAENARHQEFLRRVEAEDFNIAFLSFEDSRHQLEQALDLNTSLKDSAKVLGKSTDRLLHVVKRLQQNRAHLDQAEFKGYSSAQLGKEALMTAQRVAPQLESIADSLYTREVDVHLLQSLPKLEGDLLRLQWMTRRLQ